MTSGRCIGKNGKEDENYYGIYAAYIGISYLLGFLIGNKGAYHIGIV